ncbi:MAG TPA: hypothetical protein O0X39_04620 [Methanocorpusculum sp.]|nr:hypothetical protein [Methanocorpusculum sp.]
MITFLIGIAILIAGYFIWGKIAERLFGPDDRKTPAVEHCDNVDRVVMPKWKNTLLHLLNIAGIGPIIGVALGMKFGPIVFLILPIGNIIGGAVHDYFAGMISMRNNGADLPLLVRKFLGHKVGNVFLVFMTFALLLTTIAFTNIPAGFVQQMLGNFGLNGIWVFVLASVLIFGYYIVSTIFPINKIIGKIYPVVGLFLFLMSILLIIFLVPQFGNVPDVVFTPEGLYQAITAHPDGLPIIPMLFITIACGILSGFHATQAPIVARTVGCERDGRHVYYGMMVMEGVIAMIWAAGASILYNLKPEMLAESSGNNIVFGILNMAFPSVVLVVFGVVLIFFFALTSGDTALRSSRVSLAGYLKIDQIKMRNRLLLLLPLVVIVGAGLIWANLVPQGYTILWNYFSWFNQIMAVFAFLMATVYLVSKGKQYLITLVPGAFILFIVSTYFFWMGSGHTPGVPFGFALPHEVSCIMALVVTAVVYFFAVLHGKKLLKNKEFEADEE